MDVPHLHDDIQRHIAGFVAHDLALRSARALQLVQYETSDCTRRCIGAARGWLQGDDAQVLVSSMELEPLETLFYNFTPVRFTAPGRSHEIGILECNHGQQEYFFVDTPHKPMVAILPWGVRTLRQVRYAGWSRATRTVRIAVPVWAVPRAWGFDVGRCCVSKVVVTSDADDEPGGESYPGYGFDPVSGVYPDGWPHTGQAGDPEHFCRSIQVLDAPPPGVVGRRQL
jgi:hypothetical protein